MALGNLDKIKIMCLGDLTRDQPIFLHFLKLENIPKSPIYLYLFLIQRGKLILCRKMKGFSLYTLIFDVIYPRGVAPRFKAEKDIESRAK